MDDFHIETRWVHGLRTFPWLPHKAPFFFSYKECPRDFSIFYIDNLPLWVKITSIVGFIPIKAHNTN